MAAGAAWTNPSGGVCPFGLVIVGASPVALSINIGQQKQMVGRGGSRMFFQFIISAPGPGTSGPNTGNVYLLRKGYNKTQSNGLIAIIAPGQVVPIPGGIAIGVLLNPDDYVLDADVQGEGAYVSGVKA